MKKPVMQRKLFANGGQVQSEGILSGFSETLEDGYEDRTPDNLEIIANNLRGDIRSMDERYMELAQLVGESAFETPEEVIALMQAQFAQQAPPENLMSMDPPQQEQAQGIEALGAPQAPAGEGVMSGFGPEAGMEQEMDPNMNPAMAQQMQPGMEQMGMAPGMEQPMQMADGGLVYRQAGSPPGGEIAPGRRYLGFMRYLDPGMLPDPRTMDPRATAIPRVAVQTTVPMTGLLSPEAYSYLQSGAGQAGSLPKQISPALRYATNISEAMRNVIPTTREAGRILMGTPGGRVATGAALTLGSLPFFTGYGQETSEGGPVYSEVPGVDAQGKYQPVLRSVENMAGTPEEKAAVREVGFQDLLAPGLGMAEELIRRETPRSGVVSPETGRAKEVAPPKAVPSEAIARASIPQAEKERTYRDRVKEKMEIYSEFLGGDPEMRKAQALFALAEASLNVAGATGQSIGERLAKGVKGLPSAMGAIGAEAEKDRRAIAAASIQSVENEIANEQKNATAIARELMRYQNKPPGKAQQIANVLVQRNPELRPQEALLLGTEIDTGLVEINKDTGEAVDKITGTVRFSPYKPLSPASVGYIDESNPFATVSSATIEPATLDERKTLINRRSELQKSIAQNEKMLADIYGDTIGFLPTIQSGVSRLTLATVGDLGLGLTDVAKNQIRQNLAINKEAILKANLRNSGRPSVYDQKKIEGLVEDPNKLFASPELVISGIQNFVRSDINELARIDAQLFGGPVKEIGRIPTGAKSDPLPLTKNIGIVLDQIFTNRPNAEIWTKLPDGRAIKMTASDYFAQKNAQEQAQ